MRSFSPLPPLSVKEQSLRAELCDRRTELVGLLSYLSAPNYTRAIRLMLDIEMLGGDLRVEVYKSNLAEVQSIAGRVGFACDCCGNGAYDANGSPVECVRCGSGRAA